MHDNRLLPVICLMGTTATGKTDAAAYLTEHLPAEIISVDSSLVYKGMDIGTAKPDSKFLKKYPHHLVDIRHPNDVYSVAEFYNDACELIKQITERGQIPVLAGGTMFYFNALESGLPELPEANEELREEIDQQAEKEGWPALHKKLMKLDAERARKIDEHDAQRIQRALEMVIQSGKTIAELSVIKKPPLPNPMMKIALAFSDRQFLHERIAKRFDIMLKQGLVSEVETLLSNGVQRNATSMKMIGYRQVLDYLENTTTYQEMQLKGVSATRQLAKRQLTWLRNQSAVNWWVDEGLVEKDFCKLLHFINQKLAYFEL